MKIEWQDVVFFSPLVFLTGYLAGSLVVSIIQAVYLGMK